MFNDIAVLEITEKPCATISFFVNKETLPINSFIEHFMKTFVWNVSFQLLVRMVWVESKQKGDCGLAIPSLHIKKKLLHLAAWCWAPFWKGQRHAVRCKIYIRVFVAGNLQMALIPKRRLLPSNLWHDIGTCHSLCKKQWDFIFLIFGKTFAIWLRLQHG